MCVCVCVGSHFQAFCLDGCFLDIAAVLALRVKRGGSCSLPLEERESCTVKGSIGGHMLPLKV